MTAYNILTLAGVPTAMGAIIGFLLGKLKTKRNEELAIKKGLQALLRDRLLSSFKFYRNQGYCEIDDKETWEAMYQQYHSLGKNGVMDKVREEFLTMPVK